MYEAWAGRVAGGVVGAGKLRVVLFCCVLAPTPILSAAAAAGGNGRREGRAAGALSENRGCERQGDGRAAWQGRLTGGARGS